jgi:hypothetical protein
MIVFGGSYRCALYGERSKMENGRLQIADERWKMDHP